MPYGKQQGAGREGGIRRASPWQHAQSVGLPVLDLDHQLLNVALGIFENEVSYATRSQTLSKVVGFLLHFSDEHFKREELLMERLGYPGLAQHKGSHDIMRAWMEASLPEIGSLRNPQYDDEALAYLFDWWSGHSGREDVGYAEFIRHRLDDAKRIVDTLPRLALPDFLTV